MTKMAYGSYAHAQNEVDFSVENRVGETNQKGDALTTIWTYTLSGILHGTDQADLTAKINALLAAYATDGKDLIFYLDDGTTRTAHYLISRDSVAGTKVIKRPSFPTSRGAEYSTFRSYTIQVEAEYRLRPGDENVDFNETIEFTGGGEAWTMMTALQGPPQRQTLAQQTPFFATQSGSATGREQYPNIPGPFFPGAEHVPQRRITRSKAFKSWTVNWVYEFESVSPLG